MSIYYIIGERIIFSSCTYLFVFYQMAVSNVL